MAEQQFTVEYRDIPGFPGYRVGDDGTVWSCWRKKGLGQGRGATHYLGDSWILLKGGLDKDGYRKVILCANGHRRYARVNVLILQVFIGPAPMGMLAAHENGVRGDNRLSNLRWDTQKNNVADKVRHGTAQVGDKNSQSILTEQDVIDARTMRSRGMTFKQIAAHLGRKLPTVYAAISGKNWKHVN